jgi:hypothetical protein
MREVLDDDWLLLDIISRYKSLVYFMIVNLISMHKNLSPLKMLHLRLFWRE